MAVVGHCKHSKRHRREDHLLQNTGKHSNTIQNDHLLWEYVCCLLLTTRCLGGYPITIYAQFCTRAVQDVLSANLHLVRTTLNDPILGKQMRRAFTLRCGGHKDFLSLIKHPQSIPLDIPMQPENYVQREVRKGIIDFVVNEDIRCLFSLNADQYQQDLVNDLANIKPCNPKLLNKLYALSNVGLQEKWTGMFANTRSIQQTAFKSWSNELEVVETVKNVEARYALYLQKRKEDPQADEMKTCPCITRYTQAVRETAWGIEIEGITMPPQQEQTQFFFWDRIPAPYASRSILITEQLERMITKTHFRGQYTPYFGSATRLRAKRATLQVIEVGSVVNSVKQLMELHGWVKGNETLTQLIERLITEKTDLSMGDLAKYTRQVYSGAISHRLPCPALRRGGMANYNLNHASFYKVTSDTALEYAKGGTNYTICFQSCFLYGLAVLAHRYEICLPTPRQTGLVFYCSGCTWILPPETFIIHIGCCDIQGAAS